MEATPTTTSLALEPHPLLRCAAFTTELGGPLGQRSTPEWLLGLLAHDAEAPVHWQEPVRQAVREMLRHGGYRPAGRGKPASEYLLRAAAAGGLRSINPAVDACNAVCLHSGLPGSVLDSDLARPPWRIAIAAAGERYVFNPSGQAIDLAGLVCLFDAVGPCANAVKDAQRTKTHSETVRTLSVLWGVAGHEELLAKAEAWYRELLERLGATTREVEIL